MTVIAWDGTTLAADKRMTNSYGNILTVTKIERIGDRLVGFTGSADRIGAFRRWLENGAQPSEYPENPKDDNVFVHVITPDGKVYRYEDTPWPTLIEDAVYAAGSGADAARAAMLLGCTSARAVEIASLIDAGCGNGVDTLTFEPLP